MGRYTVMNDPAADAAVQEVLDRVSTELQDLLGDRLRAVVLVGGYGRGEGGIYLADGEYRLVNDLDLLVFMNRGLRPETGIYAAVKDLGRRLLPYGRGLKEIDLELTSVWRYRFLAPNSVGYYEIASGHQVVYGDPGVSACFRALNPPRLPAYEGANYFRNRGSGLLLPAVYFLTGSLQDPDKKKNFQIEMHKACQAMGDALLLLAGQYHYSYRERLHRFQRLDLGVLGLADNLRDQVRLLYEWGVGQKISPNFNWSGDEAMMKKWFTVQKTFNRFFLWFESSRLGQKFRDWLDYAAYLERGDAGEPWTVKVRTILGGMLRARERAQNGAGNPGNNLPPSRQGLMVMPLLLFALLPDLRVETDYVRLAAKILRQSMAEINVKQWRRLVGHYMVSFYPKDIVYKALAPLDIEQV